jgi:hypothetical protein
MNSRPSRSGDTRFRRRWLLSTLAVGVVLASATPALATDTGPASTSPTDPTGTTGGETGSLEGSDLDVAQGQEAVDELEAAGTLDAVAADVGLGANELEAELLDDPSMFVTDTGFVGYADTHDPDTPNTRDAAAQLPGDVFALASRPGAARTIYLDFTGHSSVDSVWQREYPGSNVSAPFSLDGDPGSFSTAEQAVIAESWQRVAEDYRSFDVNVTTADPGVDALRRTSLSDGVYGQRLVVTPSNFTGNSGVIGIALLDQFDAPFDHAAYVFTDASSKRTAKVIGEAASHEVGHTLALRHDGGPGTAGYYDGHGSWAPIMGRSIATSTPVTQWSRGEYAGANNTEDDLAIIAGYVGYRADDHANTAAGATMVAASSTTLGNIERTGDRDVFAVDVVAGALSVQVRPPVGEANWSNLAATVTVRNSSGVVVGSGTPVVPSGWVLDVAMPAVPAVAPVPAGRYTIEVAPVGWLSAFTGFSTYASLGAYELVVGASAGDQPVNDTPALAVPSAITAITPVRLVDTRNGLGAPGRVGAGGQVAVPVAGSSTVPTDATAAVLTITAVNPSAAGFVTVFPCSANAPDTSTLNFAAGQTVANTTMAALSGAGRVCVRTSADADILVDITGWLSPNGAARLTPVGPVRVVDTRSGVGGGRVGGGGTLTVDVGASVAAGSSAVALNVTAVNASAAGFVTVFPCGAGRPDTSTVNFVAGEARPNNTVVGVSGGRVCVFSSTDVDVLVDVVGSFGASGLNFLPTPPVRVLDTRAGVTPVAGATVTYDVGGTGLGGRIPGAASVNVTAANHQVDGFVTTFDCVTRGDTSTLNQRVGAAVANGAVVPLSGLQSCAWTSGGGDVIVDVNGWWVP